MAVLALTREGRNAHGKPSLVNTSSTIQFNAPLLDLGQLEHSFRRTPRMPNSNILRNIFMFVTAAPKYLNQMVCVSTTHNSRSIQHKTEIFRKSPLTPIRLPIQTISNRDKALIAR